MLVETTQTTSPARGTHVKKLTEMIGLSRSDLTLTPHVQAVYSAPDQRGYRVILLHQLDGLSLRGRQ